MVVSKLTRVPAQIVDLVRTAEGYTLAWQSQLLPFWALSAERVQVVTPLPGSKICQVQQWESMSGIVAYIFKYFMDMQRQLDESNVHYLEELKIFAEEQSE